jgi:hypothetical protein
VNPGNIVNLLDDLWKVPSTSQSRRLSDEEKKPTQFNYLYQEATFKRNSRTKSIKNALDVGNNEARETEPHLRVISKLQ